MGGIEQTIDQLARGTSSLGIDTSVLSLTSDDDTSTLEIDGYSSCRAKQDFQIASTGLSLSVIKKFSEIARQADVIHYHFPWPFMDLVHFLVRANKPSVVTYHSDIIRQKKILMLYQPLMNKFLASVDCIVATSPNYLKTSEVLRKFSDKVKVIPIGLCKESYPLVNLEREQHWLSVVGDKFFLFVGVLRYYKGLHILLDAARDTNYPIVIVGAGTIESKLKAQAITLGLKNIYFLGLLPEIDKVTLFKLCYGVILPSHLRSEAFGISLLEGAMYGKPMISCEIGTGTTFINIADETGLVVPPNDPEALRRAMRHLWNNPELAEKMGKSAEIRYWKHFTADQMVDSYVDLYKEIALK